jgi:hypothetical protein
MKTEPRATHLLQLAQRQRRFEWQLARDEQTRAAARLVAGKTHDLLNLIQIVKLSTEQLGQLCSEPATEFLVDLERAGSESERSLRALMAIARPDVAIARGAPVGAAIDAAAAALRPALAIDVHLASPPDTATRCTAQELEHVLIGLALDALGNLDEDAARAPLELVVRERKIDGEPWIEIVCASVHAAPDDDDDHFELRAVTAIVERAGGELATSERRGGGLERIVALPVA